MTQTPRAAQETARDYALRVIRERIVTLALEPGCMVSEQELSRELGTSRGPVREALIELAAVKIVEVYPQRGNRIALIDYSLVEQACFLRETLECAVVERCCNARLGEEALAVLRENIRLQRLYWENGYPEKLMDLDDAFHLELFRGAGVLDIHVLMERMMVHFDRVRAMSLTTVRELKIVEDHAAILRAVEELRCADAQALMRKHLNRYRVDQEAIRAKYPQYVRG